MRRSALAPALAAAAIAAGLPRPARPAPRPSGREQGAQRAAERAWRDASGTLFAVSWPAGAAPGAPGQAAARGALARRAGIPDKALTLVREAPLARGALLVYRQTHRGLPVVGGAAAARLDERGRLRWMAWSARPLGAVASAPALPAGEAARRAAAALGLPAPARPSARLAVWAPPLGEARLAWRVWLPADLAALTAPVVWLDATTGGVLARGDRLWRASPRADVFEVSPVVTPELTRVELTSLDEGAQRLATGALVALNCPDTRTCREIYPDTYYHACEPAPLAAPDGGGDFLYPYQGDVDPDDELPEVMAFYQADKALAVARGLGLPPLGDTVHLVVNYRRYNSNSIEDCQDGSYDGDGELAPVDNAFFTADGQGLGPDRTGPHVVLAQGHAADYALDGDVVQHELGHAVMHDLWPDLPRELVDRFGTDMSPAGLHEGYADLFTALVTGDPRIGEYVSSRQGDGEPLRDLTVRAACPGDVTGQAHEDSLPWTSGVWRARQQVAGGDPDRRRAFDRAVIAGWMALGEAAGYERAAAVTLMELEVELGAQAAADARRVLEEHGLTGCGGRVVDGAAGVDRSALPGVPDLEAGGVRPGPFQLRYRLERRAAALALDVAVYDADTLDPLLRRASARLKEGEAPIEWSAAGGDLTSDHRAEAPL
ncbi:MAG TPA: hypothetical protein VKZ63_12935, partial [Kofleriaceae bacterium]|nr:hypothetical protein [Kofleriaceae bacterium]